MMTLASLISMSLLSSAEPSCSPAAGETLSSSLSRGAMVCKGGARS